MGREGNGPFGYEWTLRLIIVHRRDLHDECRQSDTPIERSAVI